jgi:integrase
VKEAAEMNEEAKKRVAGVELATVKELLGHKSLTMTMRYSHLSPEHKARAVGILENILNRTATSQSTSQSGA